MATTPPRTASMLIRFVDGSKITVRYPKQAGNDAATIAANVRKASRPTGSCSRWTAACCSSRSARAVRAGHAGAGRAAGERAASRTDDGLTRTPVASPPSVPERPGGRFARLQAALPAPPLRDPPGCAGGL